MREVVETLDDGRPVEIVALTNANGLSASVMTLGATLQSLHLPDRDGTFDDVVLGHDAPRECFAHRDYFGASVGRYANRIAHGRFALDGREYRLDTNDGPHHLHGGKAGFDQKIWTLLSLSDGDEACAEFELVSPDGDGGYPGTLRVTASYALDNRDQLRIEYRATTDAPTIVSVTNHALFNLAGSRARSDVLGQRLTLYASRYMPVDATLIPTGELAPVAGTPFDFREPREIGSGIREGDAQIRVGRGYDHNFVIDGEAGTLRPAARLEDPRSGRAMEMFVTAPGLQVYSGNFLDGTVLGKDGCVYRQSDGLALEPQCFPDSPNRPDFPSVRLDPGMEYVNTMVLRFSQVAR